MNNLNPITSDTGKFNKVSNGPNYLPHVCKENLVCLVDSATMISIDVFIH